MKLTIGEKIALLRKKRNVTQTELAEYLYLTPQTVSRWEVGSGTPEVTLLPRIATFFGVSIDELFGVTSLERTEDLAVKYSILRDDSSLREAMEQIDSQLQTVDAALSGGLGDAETLMRDHDKLESLKIHVLINQGREAFKRAYEITDRFVQKTEGHPEHPWDGAGSPQPPHRAGPRDPGGAPPGACRAPGRGHAPALSQYPAERRAL